MTALLCLAAFGLGYCLGKGVANYRAVTAMKRLNDEMRRPLP